MMPLGSRPLAVLPLLLLLAAGGQADNQPSTTLSDCVVTLIDEVQVPARDAGVLMGLSVREGAPVKGGQVIAQLDDNEAAARYKIAQAEYQVALEQTRSDVRVRAAQADATITETEYLLADDLSSDSKSDAQQARLRRLLLAPRRAQLETEVAQLDFRIARLNGEVRRAQLDAAENGLSRRQIQCPLNGIVVRVHRHAGEWVNPGDTIVHVVRMDRLRVEGFVRASDYAPEEVLGRAATVTVHLTRGRTEQLTSKIAFASPLIETNGQYRVFAEVDNVRRRGNWMIRPGLTADMEIRIGSLDTQ